jgi:hypothetical protein
MAGDNPNLPMGGHTGYGVTRRDFPSEAAFHDEQNAAVRLIYTSGPDSLPKLYDCGICGGYHPNGFHGDCRQDLFRIDDPDLVFGEGYWTEIEMEAAD